MSSEIPQIESESPLPVPAAPRRWTWWCRLLLVVGAVMTVVAAIPLGLGCLGVSYASWTVPESPLLSATGQPAPEELASLESKLAALRPSEPYVVIDTYDNRLRVYQRGELLRDAVCSTGSGVVLLDPRGERSWTFDSPLGERRVQRKVKNPVWAKPDWAFIEDGFIPPKDPNLRFDDFSLGNYALYLGDGYIIHGTIFQTLLGRPVTHGCVRLGDEDLEYVYRKVPLGARVYLY